MLRCRSHEVRYDFVNYLEFIVCYMIFTILSRIFFTVKNCDDNQFGRLVRYNVDIILVWLQSRF